MKYYDFKKIKGYGEFIKHYHSKVRQFTHPLLVNEIGITLECLSDVNCPGSTEILEAIIKHRGKQK